MAVSRRLGDEIHPQPPNGDLRPISLKNSDLRSNGFGSLWMETWIRRFCSQHRFRWWIVLV